MKKIATIDDIKEIDIKLISICDRIQALEYASQDLQRMMENIRSINTPVGIEVPYRHGRYIGGATPYVTRDEIMGSYHYTINDDGTIGIDTNSNT